MSARASRFLGLGLLSVPLLVLAQAPSNDVAYEVVCGEFSGESDTIVCRNASLSDGTNRITAGNLDTEKTESTATGGRIWHLNQGIRVTVGNSVLEADSGVFEFDRETLVFAELVGSPVTLTDFDAETDTTFSGSADTISIDNRLTTARLLGRAVLTRRSGQQEPIDYEGCDWIYNWTDHSFNAGTPDCGVRLILAPIRNDQDSESTTVTP